MDNERSASVVTANELTSGQVVFLSADGQWSKHICAAAVATDNSRRDALLDIAQAHTLVIVDPYAIDVHLAADGLPVPTSLREQLRAAGPTLARQRPRHGQAEAAAA